MPAAGDRGHLKGTLAGVGGSSSSIPTPTPTKFWRRRLFLEQAGDPHAVSSVWTSSSAPVSRLRLATVGWKAPRLATLAASSSRFVLCGSAWSGRLAAARIVCASACMRRASTPPSYGSAKSDGGVAADGQLNSGDSGGGRRVSGDQSMLWLPPSPCEKSENKGGCWCSSSGGGATVDSSPARRCLCHTTDGGTTG
jgi:hypothetical protein